MSNDHRCTQSRYGNLWQDPVTDGPVEGRYERTCSGDNYQFYSSSYFFSSQKPDNVQEVRKALESDSAFGSSFSGLFAEFQKLVESEPMLPLLDYEPSTSSTSSTTTTGGTLRRRRRIS